MCESVGIVSTSILAYAQGAVARIPFLYEFLHFLQEDPNISETSLGSSLQQASTCGRLRSKLVNAWR